MMTATLTQLTADAMGLRRRASELAGSHRDIWQRKPVLREVYADVYRRVTALLSPLDGPVIELGGGPGVTKHFLPNVISSDIAAAPWLDFAGDAHAIPLASNSISNIMMIDVLHHLSRPLSFFSEIHRILRPGGRLVIVDMYLSLMSWPVLHFIHPEPATLTIRPMECNPDEPLFCNDDPWASDQGIARGIFWKQPAKFSERFAHLKIVHRSRFSTVLWPLTGGFDHKDRVPRRALPLLRRLDRWLELAGALTAFRSLIALEKGDAAGLSEPGESAC